MKTIIATILISLFSVAGLNAEPIVKINEWHYIKMDIPKGKIGGGDYYNIIIKPELKSYKFKTEDDGIRLMFTRPGSYDLTITINHIVKSSCAGVRIEPYSSSTFSVTVSP